MKGHVWLRPGPVLLLAALATLTFASEAAAAPKFRLIDLGTLTPSQPTEARAVNSAGRAAVTGDLNGQFYNGSTVSTACSLVEANSLNGLDQIAGYVNVRKKGQWVTVAAICAGGTLTELPSLAGAVLPEATDINDSGIVVGTSWDGTDDHAFRYAAGSTTDLGRLPGHAESWAHAINATGAIVGWSFTSGVSGRSVIWENGVIRELMPGSNTHAYDINDNGQIVGSGSNANAYVYTNGVVVDLGRLPGTTFSVAHSINNLGEIVGHSGGNSNVGTPFLYTEGTMYDLNSLVELAPGWVLKNAKGINDRGYIVGQATNPSGATRAYLLKPTDLSRFVPEFRYDSRETYITGSPAMMTDNYRSDVSEPYTNRLLDSTGLVLAAADPAHASDTLSLQYLGSGYPSGGAASSSDYIDASNDYEVDAQRMQAQSQYGNIVYGREWPLASGGKILQYWLFYYYNGPRPLNIGLHEGDWEMVQLNLDASGSPYRASYAQHNGGERCDWVHVQRTITGRPIVYVGWGSHASFFSAGTHDIDAGAYLDEADGIGAHLTPNVVEVTAPPAWMDWSGHWGGSGDTPGTSSPDGPPFKGEQWNAPALWAENVSGCTESQTSGGSSVQGSEPSVPELQAESLDGAIRIEYDFSKVKHGRSARNVEIVTTIDPDNDRYMPLTRVTRVTGETGSVVQSTGLAGEAYEVRVSVLAKNGRLSRAVVVPVE